MKKALSITSVLCLLVAVLSVVFGIAAFKFTNRSWYMSFALFSLFTKGGVMGFLGNVLIVLLTCASYGLSGLYGLARNYKNALIWSAVSAVLALISLVVVILNRSIHMTAGDLMITAIPIAQLILVFRNAD